MLVVEVSDLLANQMFAYAACKTLALDKHYSFAFCHKRIDNGMGSYHVKDKKFGRDISTIFSIPSSEEIFDIPEGMAIHRESDFRKESNYYPEFRDVEDNTYMVGHFISPKFFWHRINDVKEWFAFPEEVKSKVNEKFEKIKGMKNISVHFRVGDDYRNFGFLLDGSYWNNAAIVAKQLWGGDVNFIVFYDKKTRCVIDFLDNYNAAEMHGSLVEDLYAMTLCDGHIISNSTYSMMGALLDGSGAKKIIRPSIYPISHKENQRECFLENWEIVEAKRSKIGYICSLFRVGKIRNKVINVITKRS